MSDTSDTKPDVRYAPNYTHYRHVSAVDTVSSLTRAAGSNAARFRRVHVQVVPEANTNMDVQVYFWSEAAGKFIPQNPPLTKPGPGIGLPWEFSFDAGGRVFLVAAEASSTFVPGEFADVYVSGFDHESVAP